MDSVLADTQQSLGRLAVDIPGATAVFRRLKLDFCCGGQQTLEKACETKQLDAVAVLDELHSLQQPRTTLVAPTASELVDHILENFHEVHRRQLPELIRMAARVQAVHRDHPLVPLGLAEHLETMEQELVAHMEKEEQVLFPMFKHGGHPLILGPIGMMRHEHVDHGAQLDKLAALTHQHEPPQGACNTWRALYAGTRQLQDDLMEHIHTENNILFPLFEQA